MIASAILLLTIASVSKFKIGTTIGASTPNVIVTLPSAVGSVVILITPPLANKLALKPEVLLELIAAANLIATSLGSASSQSLPQPSQQAPLTEKASEK